MIHVHAAAAKSIKSAAEETYNINHSLRTSACYIVLVFCIKLINHHEH